MKTNLLKLTENLDTNITVDIAQSIADVLEERKLFLEIREPMSEGKVYDDWCEKYDALDDICYIVQDLIEAIGNEDVGDIEDNVNELQKEVDSYQCLHGGLSRLKCEI